MCTQQSRGLYELWSVHRSWHCSCQTYVWCFPLALTNVCPWTLMPFFQISLENSDLKTTHNTFRDCCEHFFQQPSLVIDTFIYDYTCPRFDKLGLEQRSWSQDLHIVNNSAFKSHTNSTKAVDIFLNDLAFKLHNWKALNLVPRVSHLPMRDSGNEVGKPCCSRIGVLKCFVVGALFRRSNNNIHDHCNLWSV